MSPWPRSFGFDTVDDVVYIFSVRHGHILLLLVRQNLGEYAFFFKPIQDLHNFRYTTKGGRQLILWGIILTL